MRFSGVSKAESATVTTEFIDKVSVLTICAVDTESADIEKAVEGMTNVLSSETVKEEK